MFKKASILIAFVFLFHNILSAQTIDSAYFSVYYNLIYVPDSLKPEHKKSDVLHLLIGKQVNSFFSYIQYKSDSAFREDIKNGIITYEEFAKGEKNRSVLL
jgi:GLPGLI family protein